MSRVLVMLIGAILFLPRLIVRKVQSFVALMQSRSPLAKLYSFVPVHYRLMEAYKPDIVFAHDLSTLALASKVADDVGAKLVFDSHELELHRNPPMSAYQKAQVEWIERHYLPRCDHVTTVCESIETILRAEYGLKNTSVFYNAPRLGKAVNHPRWERRSGGNLRYDAGLEDGDFALLYTGLITMNRGIEFTLETLVCLPEHIKLVALGPGSADMKSELTALAKSIGLSERFVILDPVNPSDVSRYASGADAAIIPIEPVTLSYEVALPNKFFESAFARLPIISADLIEISKFIERYGLGTTYRAADPVDCSNAIMRVHDRYEEYKISKEKANAFQAEYAWNVQEKRLVALADQLIEIRDGEKSDV